MMFLIMLGTGRSVPTTPLQASPQEAGPSGEEQSSHQPQPDGNIFMLL